MGPMLRLIHLVSLWTFGKRTMLPFVQEQIGAFIVNFFILSVVCAVTLVVCLAILTAIRLCVQCVSGCHTLVFLPAVHIYNTGRAAYIKFQESHPPYPPEDWV
ncbi:envelope protein [Pipistrellus abramus bat coronavirus HKU5-related]|nr:envelope protein [Pipistrellus abramus bat coronavirus HKU5-related]